MLADPVRAERESYFDAGIGATIAKGLEVDLGG
jgi:hypothetical protein